MEATNPMVEPARPRRPYLGYLLAYVPLALLLFAFHPSAQTLLVPLAGPWAARLFGHSCGMSDTMPAVSITLALLALPLFYLSLAPFGRASELGEQRATESGTTRPATKTRTLRRLRHLPLAAWWIVWLLLALISVINTTE